MTPLEEAVFMRMLEVHFVAELRERVSSDPRSIEDDENDEPPPQHEERSDDGTVEDPIEMRVP